MGRHAHAFLRLERNAHAFLATHHWQAIRGERATALPFSFSGAIVNMAKSTAAEFFIDKVTTTFLSETIV